jgi:hypothetical protein
MVFEEQMTCETWYMIWLTTSKHENFGAGVYCDDVSVPGQKMSLWLKTKAKMSSKSFEKYSWSMLGVAWYLYSYWDRQAHVGCGVLLWTTVQKQLQKS